MPLRLLLWFAVAGAAAGCSTVLGLSDFTFDAQSVTDAPSDAPGDVETSDACAVDLAQQCYACTPSTTAQFLNSCADNTQCLKFERARLTGLLLADGALPPLPPLEAGAQ